MELDRSSGRLKNIDELDTVVTTLTTCGGLKGYADQLQLQAKEQKLIVHDGDLRMLAGPFEFGPKYRHEIIVNLRRAALGKKPAYGQEPVRREIAEHARTMLEPFGLLEPLHKRLFARFVNKHEAPPTTEPN